MKPIIRPYQPVDFDAVIILWRASREVSLPDFQLRKGHFFYEDLAYFQEHVLPDNDVWVVEEDGRPIAFLAMKADFIDHLYVHPDHWRMGIGRMLLEHARTLSPLHLWLYTLQVNLNARAFYEKNGFVITKLGVSQPPENEPDVKYEWFGGVNGK
jgi:GNAT superfamily N-acetyltransferase